MHALETEKMKALPTSPLDSGHQKKKKKEKKFVTDLLSETNKSLQFYQHTISE